MWHLGQQSKLAQAAHIHFNLSHKPSIPLYITNTIKSFALSMAGLYVPIFIYVTFRDTLIFNQNTILNGIYFILAFYFVRSLSTLVLMNKVVNFIFGEVNFKWSIFISNLLLASAMYLLIMSEKYLIFLFISAIIFSIETLLYWIPFHTHFIRIIKQQAENKENTKFGTGIGLRFFLGSIASAAGPVLGGVIIKLYGFNILFFATTVLLVASALPVLLGTHEHKHGMHSFFGIMNKYLFKKNYRWNTVAHMAAGLDGNLYAIFAPFLLFIVADENTSSVGLIVSIAVLLASLFTLISGKLIDTNGSRHIQKISTIFNSVLYLPRIFIGTPFIIYAVDIFDKINGSFLSIPLMSAAYDQAKQEENEADYIIYREFFIHLGVLIGIVIFSIALIAFENWRLIFAILALVSPFTYLIYFTNNLKSPTN